MLRSVKKYMELAKDIEKFYMNLAENIEPQVEEWESDEDLTE